jgi:hypothetical protein
MDWLSRIFRKLQILGRRERFKLELQEEMSFHREQVEQELIADGMSAKDAHFAAKRQFGNDVLLRETSHRIVGLWFESVLQDVSFSVRQLHKNPGFALTAVISLALGIGATTAVFSVIYATLIHPFPYPDADRIVRLFVQGKGSQSQRVSLNSPQIQQLRHSPAIDHLVAVDEWSVTLTGRDLPENVQATSITSNGFNFLGVPTLLGRGILPSDAMDGQQPQNVAVLGNRFWQRHFNADPEVLGKTLHSTRRITES